MTPDDAIRGAPDHRNRHYQLRLAHARTQRDRSAEVIARHRSTRHHEWHAGPMQARVWVGEWRIGDWGRPIDLGQMVTFLVCNPDPGGISWLGGAIGAHNAATVTHVIADVDTDFTEEIHGRVDAIRAIRVRYPSPRGGSPMAGSGVLTGASRATLMGEPGPDGLTVMGYLIDINTSTDQR